MWGREIRQGDFARHHQNNPSVFMAIAPRCRRTGKPYQGSAVLVARWPKLDAQAERDKLYDPTDAPLLVAQGAGVMGGQEYSTYVL